MKLLLASLFLASLAHAAPDCSLKCDSSSCDVIQPNGTVYANYEKNYKYLAPAMKAKKAELVEVLVPAKEQRQEIEGLLTLCQISLNK